ncbi:MAG: hypothetical protein LAT63_13605 [Marinobacter sp.]|nr:hypothetical protein [Marinobacter sp.]
MRQLAGMTALVSNQPECGKVPASLPGWDKTGLKAVEWTHFGVFLQPRYLRAFIENPNVIQ